MDRTTVSYTVDPGSSPGGGTLTGESKKLREQVRPLVNIEKGKGKVKRLSGNLRIKNKR